MKNKELKLEESKHREDYLSVRGNNAISAHGTIFSIGDKVIHEGDDNKRVGVITKFTVDTDTMDVIAHGKLENGEIVSGRIVFLYHVGDE